MATIVMAVGLGPGGIPVNLYTGESYVHAQEALLEAGQEGKISEGWLYNNPLPVVHQQYRLRESQVTQMIEIKRPRGRPRKVVPLIA